MNTSYKTAIKVNYPSSKANEIAATLFQAKLRKLILDKIPKK